MNLHLYIPYMSTYLDIRLFFLFIIMLNLENIKK